MSFKLEISVFVFLVFLTVSIGLGCNKSQLKNIPIIEDVVDQNYICARYEINLSEYTSDNHFKFKVQPIVFGGASINISTVQTLLNKDFKGANISFDIKKPQVVSFIPDEIYYTEYLEDYYEPQQITILVFPKGISLKEERRGTIQGAALGIPEISNPAKGKPIVFMREEVVHTRITSHEIAHSFGIYHTFTPDPNSPILGKSCITGDLVSTTMVPIEGAGVGNKTCDYYLPESFKDTLTQTQIESIVTNIASYSPPQCMEGFDKGQFERMRKIIEINPRIQDAMIR